MIEAKLFPLEKCKTSILKVNFMIFFTKSFFRA